MIYKSLSEIFGFEASKMVAMGIGSIGHIIITVGLVAFMLIAKTAMLNNKTEGENAGAKSGEKNVFIRK